MRAMQTGINRPHNTKVIDMSQSSLHTGSKRSEFSSRHIGPREADKKEMLKFLGFNNLTEMITKIVPKSIYTTEKMNIGVGKTEQELLKE